MSSQSSKRKRWTTDEHEDDDENDVSKSSQRGRLLQKRFDHISARDQTRLHVGDHHGDIHIHHDARTEFGASKSQSSDNVQNALESLMFDEMDERYLTISATLTSTCRWLFDREEYRRWQDLGLVSEHYGFLWIKGKAGAGKSTLMKYAFNEAEKRRKDNENVICFFFNARGAPIEKSLEGMFRSLLYQTFDKIPRLRHLLSKRRAVTAQRQGWSLVILQDVFRDAIESLGSDHLTCYVDALDECTENDVEEMVSFFEELGESAVANGFLFHVCFASRHYPFINIERSETMTLEDSDGHKEDISKYIRKKLSINNKKLKEDMTTKIELRASGVFLWVVLVVGILNTDCARGNAQAIQRRLDQIPTRITHLINDILDRGRSTRHLVPLLQWIIFSKRPLGREELYLALQCVEGQITRDAHTEWALSQDNTNKFILDSSKGLVEMTKGKNPRVQFIHELVRTHFLEDEGLVNLDRGLRSNMVGKSHNQLKQCCFNYFLGSAQTLLPASMPKAGSPGHRRLRNKIITARPFLQYVLDHTLYHANEAHGSGVEQNFFGGLFPLVIWTRLHNAVARYQTQQYSQSASDACVFARQGLANLLELALSTLPKSDASGAHCHNLLSAAVRSKDLRSVKIVLRHFPPESYRDKDKGDVLWRATSNCELEVVQTLIEAKMKTYKPSSFSQTQNALVEAACNPDRFSSGLGRFGLLRLLLDTISTEDLTNKFCRYALTSALGKVCGLGDVGMTRDLLARGADVHGDEGLYTLPLTEACRSGNEELVRLLISEGASTAPKLGWVSALAAASGAGHEGVVHLLIDKGAKVKDDSNALVLASAQGHNSIVRLLLQKSATISPGEKEVDQALIVACEGGHDATVRLLLDEGANLTTSQWRKERALSGACVAGHESIVRLLLAKGVSPVKSSFSVDGEAPMTVAIQNDRIAIAQLLLEAGVNIEATDKMDRTALWHACNQGHETLVRWLLENGAQVNTCDRRGKSALAIALTKEFKTIAQLLLEKGATFDDLSAHTRRIGSELGIM